MTGACVYLDHAATSWPKPPGVAEAVAQALEEAGSPGRGGHRVSVAGLRLVERCRSSVASFFGWKPELTFLGPGATYWLNAVIKGYVRQGDTVVVSQLEHNSVMRPLRWLQKRKGIKIIRAGPPKRRLPTPVDFKEAASRGARLVVVTHASNVSGAVLPVDEIADSVHPVPVLVDGAQAAGHVHVDLSSSPAAAYVLSGHKGLLGPAGTGVFMAKESFLEELDTWVEGGTGSASELEEMPTHYPDRLEPGTPNVCGFAGLEAAVSWLSSQGVEAVGAHARSLATLLIEKLKAFSWVKPVGVVEPNKSVGIVSLVTEGVDPGELARWLDREAGIMTRPGLHCAPAAHKWLGTFPRGTLRISFGWSSSEDEVLALCDALKSWGKLNG